MTRASGIDISVWDLSFDPALVAKPIDFVIQRVSTGYQSGAIGKDALFEELYPGVQKVPIRGAYHYLSSHSDLEAQADYFLNTVRGRDYQFYACDFEENYNDMTALLAWQADQWMQKVSAATGKPVLFYTNRSLYDTFGWMYCSKWKLWLAQYWTFPLLYHNPSLPKKRKAGDWTIWQWASEINYKGHSKEYGCGAKSVDINDFNGTVADMRLWLGLDAAPVPLPPVVIPPVGKPYHVVTPGGLCVRAAPNLDAPRVRTMTQGERFLVFGAQDVGEYTWLQLADGFAAEKRVVKTTTTFAEAE